MLRSTWVQLAVLGSAVGVYAMDPTTVELRQQRYASLDDCERDWTESGACTSQAGSSYYVGPRYYWDSDRGQPMVVGADGRPRVAASRISAAGSAFGESHAAGSFARGGFGAFGRGFGARS